MHRLLPLEEEEHAGCSRQSRLARQALSVSRMCQSIIVLLNLTVIVMIIAPSFADSEGDV
jgi:hypothetical protein